MTVIFTVPQSHCVVIERLGRYSRVCKQGLHFRMPILESVRRLPEWGGVATKRDFLVELTEQQTDTPPRECHTKDNVSITANASVYWRILDPRKALYEVDVLPRSVSDIALNALRSNVGMLELDEVLSERQKLNERIAQQLAETAKKWGIQFTRVEIQELTTSDDTASAMRQQMEGERRRRAMVAEAEGRAEAELKVAQAERDATILRAEGVSKGLEAIARAELIYLQRLTESIDAEAAARVLVAQKVLDGFEKISKNPSHKVFLPNAVAGLISLDGEDARGRVASLDPLT